MTLDPMNAMAFASFGIAAIVFLFVWYCFAFDELGPKIGGLVLGWMPAAIVAAIAGVMSFGIMFVVAAVFSGMA